MDRMRKHSSLNNDALNIMLRIPILLRAAVVFCRDKNDLQHAVLKYADMLQAALCTDSSNSVEVAKETPGDQSGGE